MAYIVRVDGGEVDSDSFTLGDLELCEKESGQFWSVMNPWRDVKVARVFLRIALMHQGATPEDAADRAAGMTLGDIKSAFDYREDEPMPQGDDDAAPLRRGRSSPASSGGAAAGSTGPRKKHAAAQ